jgi:hypothetical protein
MAAGGIIYSRIGGLSAAPPRNEAKTAALDPPVATHIQPSTWNEAATTVEPRPVLIVPGKSAGASPPPKKAPPVIGVAPARPKEPDRGF